MDRQLGMFEKFTEGSLKVLLLAQEEARRLGHKSVDSEHILLGLIGEGKGTASQFLRESGLNLKSCRIVVEEKLGIKDEYSFLEKLIPAIVEIPFSKNAKTLLEKSLQVAISSQHEFVATEHLLLGFLDSPNDAAIDVIEKQGVSAEELRKAFSVKQH